MRIRRLELVLCWKLDLGCARGGLVLLAVLLSFADARGAPIAVRLRSSLYSSLQAGPPGIPADSSVLLALRYAGSGSEKLGSFDRTAPAGLADLPREGFGSWANRIFPDGSVVVGAGRSRRAPSRSSGSSGVRRLREVLRRRPCGSRRPRTAADSAQTSE